MTNLNLDCMSVGELDAFAHRAKLAKRDEAVKIVGNILAPVKTMRQLGVYASYKASAMRWRLQGNIQPYEVQPYEE